ncbi:Maleylacetoacetate isomerase [Stipitochalara longipes BDJ]|nr:Maleylacetoacetate isomerase [Stipitochalara longipes BDJ]
MEQQNLHLHLHTYFRSSCSARVRTAAHYKGIPLTYTYIHLLSNAQSSPEYLSTNPSASVPTLTVTVPNKSPIIIRQSVPILEFFEEYFPSTPKLLPESAVDRAKVRELVAIIASDLQPVTNLRVLRGVKKLSGGKEEAPGEWAKEWMSKGLLAYDKVAEAYAGKYSVGDEVSMADVCLAPAVEGALRYGIDLDGEGLGTVKRVYENVRGLEAFRKGDWKHQGDTPEEFRVKDES